MIGKHIIRWTIGSCIIVTMHASSQSLEMYSSIYQKMMEAQEQDDYETSLEEAVKILRLLPTHPRIHHHAARMHAILGNKKEAFDHLLKTILLGYVMDVDRDSVFRTIQDQPDFQMIRNKIEAMKKPVRNSTEAFKLYERDLVPEGMCYDPVSQVFYFGSTYKEKIIKVDMNGHPTDFCTERQDGLRTVLGMKVDPERRFLWVNTAVGNPPPRDVNPEEAGWSGLFKYDLNTGNLIKKYTLHRKGETHLFNDVAFSPQGDVYVTDSNNGAIYTVSHEADSLTLFIKSDALRYPNGIALSPDGKMIYLANSGSEIFIIDSKTKTITPLHHPDTCTTYGIDGLYLYENSLIAVQNNLERITRFYLDATGRTAVKMDILEANNPVLDIPTTGAIFEDTFYYIANCPLRAFNPDGSLNQDGLKDVIIYRIEL